MFRKIFGKNNQKQNNVQINPNINSNIKEENNVNINITKVNNIIKIEISDYISMIEFDDKVKSSDEYSVLDLLCTTVSWNNSRQKVNKGTYYIIIIDNRIYNILINDGKIKIDERTKIALDKQTQKENIIEERLITFNINEEKYRYYSAKHEQNRNTYYTKYYDKNRIYSLGALDLSEEEALNEINEVFFNLEGIEGINTILDLELLKSYISVDLRKNNIPIKIRKK